MPSDRPPDRLDQQILVRLVPNPDEAITTASHDRLRRSEFAQALANQLLSATDHGLVMALTGPWGSGKTSLLNLIDDTLRGQAGIAVLRFNPWFFSGTEQLLAHFFQELSAQLNQTADDQPQAVGKQIEKHGRLLTPPVELVPIACTYL